jgi:magnesium chelatase subunit I
MNLVDKAIRSQFLQYFPNPETFKKRRPTGKESTKEPENPYKSITRWFDSGNSMEVLFNLTDKNKIMQLYKVDGLHALVKKYFSHANEMDSALLMEFVLHGLAAYSLISKKIVDNKIEFKDLIGSMVNLGTASYGSEDFEEEEP